MTSFRTKHRTFRSRSMCRREYEAKAVEDPRQLRAFCVLPWRTQKQVPKQSWTCLLLLPRSLPEGIGILILLGKDPPHFEGSGWRLRSPATSQFAFGQCRHLKVVLCGFYRTGEAETSVF